MNDPHSKKTPEELIRLAAAAKDRPAQLRILDLLVQRTYATPQSMKTFQALAGTSSHLALDFVARMPDPVPKGVLLLAAQALPDRANPLPLRLAVAGKLLGSLPDSVQAVGPIVRSITAGLSRSRTLERMIQLQSRVDGCATLDTMVQTTEARVKLKCPKCRVKLTRPELIVHLWHEHRLIFERGHAIDPRSGVEVIIGQVSGEPSRKLPEDAYRASEHYFPESEPHQVLQAVAARQRSTGAIPLPLVEGAIKAVQSLCPTCLGPLDDRIQPLPPPLARTAHRIAGDGYSVSVRDFASQQVVELQTPITARSVVPGMSRRWSPRGLAVLIAGFFFALGCIVVWIAPRFPPFGLSLILTAIGWGLYAALRYTRPKLIDAKSRAADVAWGEIAANLPVNSSSLRFLTRLCLASPGRGTPGERAATVRRLIEWSAAKAEPNAATVQLLAAGQVLQTADGADVGKDKVNGLVKLFDAVWRGELPIDHGEYLAEIATNALQLPSGESSRLAILVLGSAFDNGLLPRDVLAIAKYLPWLNMVLGLPTPKRLQLACAVWRGKNSEPWASIGPAATLFDFAKKSPSASRKLLVACPDALLKLELPEAAQRTLGDVVLTPRGLVIGSMLLTDPEIAIDLGRSPRGSGWILKLGREFINLDRKIPADLIPVFSAWLNYRVQKLLPQAEALTRSNPQKVRQLLAPLANTCPLCGTESIGRSGQVGDPWPLTP